jgi:hypothetical protein
MAVAGQLYFYLFTFISAYKIKKNDLCRYLRRGQKLLYSKEAEHTSKVPNRYFVREKTWERVGSE